MLIKVPVRDSTKEKKDKSIYGNSYKRLKKVNRQIRFFQGEFPDIKWSEYVAVGNQFNIPDDLEGLFVVPKWELFAPSFAGAMERLFEAILRRREEKFRNRCDAKFDLNSLLEFQQPETNNFFQKIREQQEGSDFLIFPGQFGASHRSKPVEVVNNIKRKDEFCLDSFTVGAVLFSHMERLWNENDPWLDCGAEIISKRGAKFPFAPCYRIVSGKWEYCIDYPINHTCESRFVPTGFFPQLRTETFELIKTTEQITEEAS